MRGTSRSAIFRASRISETKNQKSRSESKMRIAAFAARQFVRAGDTYCLLGGQHRGGRLGGPLARLPHLYSHQQLARRPPCPIHPFTVSCAHSGWLGESRFPVTLMVPKLFAPSRSGKPRFASSVPPPFVDGKIGPSDPNPLEVEAKRASLQDRE